MKYCQYLHIVELRRFRQIIQSFHQETLDEAEKIALKTGQPIDKCINDAITKTASQARAKLEILKFIHDTAHARKSQEFQDF